MHPGVAILGLWPTLLCFIDIEVDEAPGSTGHDRGPYEIWEEGELLWRKGPDFLVALKDVLHSVQIEAVVELKGVPRHRDGYI